LSSVIGDYDHSLKLAKNYVKIQVAAYDKKVKWRRRSSADGERGVYRRITPLFLDTSCSNAENHILPTPLVFDLEFEGHAVGAWRQNLAPDN